jgi:HEPN domain-containing protein
LNPLTKEWIEKAEGDFATACREFRVRKSPNYDDVCFHSQQCIEKYLKAILQKFDIRFGKTHNLVELLEQFLSLRPLWEAYRKKLKFLSSFAVDFRYPGEKADKTTAKEALDICKYLRLEARKELELDSS